jgi:hypothetical protein
MAPHQQPSTQQPKLALKHLKKALQQQYSSVIAPSKNNYLPQTIKVAPLQLTNSNSLLNFFKFELIFILLLLASNSFPSLCWPTSRTKKISHHAHQSPKPNTTDGLISITLRF